MSKTHERYKFQFDSSSNRVVRLQEVEGRKTEIKHIAGDTFNLTPRDPTDIESDVVMVMRAKESRGFSIFESYSDIDGDQMFIQEFELAVAGSNVDTQRLDRLQFDFTADGSVSAVRELEDGRWSPERIEADERYLTLELDGRQYVIKLEQDDGSVDLTFYRDDNNDQVWTEVAEGETILIELNTPLTSVDLVGILPMLAISNDLIA